MSCPGLGHLEPRSMARVHWMKITKSKIIKVYQVASTQNENEAMLDFLKLRLWCLLAQHLPLLMVGSCASYQLFCPYVDWNPLRMGCREEQVEFCELVPKYCKYYKCKCSLLRGRSKIGTRFGTSRNPSHGPKAGKKASKIHLFQQKWICILDFVICGDFYSIPLFVMPYQTALAKPLALFDLLSGIPTLTNSPQQICRGMRELPLKRKSNHRIEPSLFTLALWKTPCEGLLAILECVGTQVWSLDFLGKYTIATTPFT